MTSIRLIQLINNYYKDNLANNPKANIPLGEYCCIGYFDALHQQLIDWNPIDATKGIKETVNDVVLQKIDGNSNQRTFICVTEKEQEDRIFWENAEKKPYLFVTILRMNHADNNPQKNIERLIESINQWKDVITYFTYEQADLVIVKTTNSYREGLDFVRAVRNQESVYKMYSVFCIRETVLRELKTNWAYNQIEDEKIFCQLRCAVKNMKEADVFISEFKKLLSARGILVEYCFHKFHILGNNDMIIKINDVPIRKILSCYLMGEILTHASELYGKAFFNVESVFLIKEEGE